MKDKEKRRQRIRARLLGRMQHKQNGMGELEEFEEAPEKEEIGPTTFHDIPEGEKRWDDIEERRFCMGPHYGRPINDMVDKSKDVKHRRSVDKAKEVIKRIGIERPNNKQLGE
jgi:hypothetical protein